MNSKRILINLLAAAAILLAACGGAAQVPPIGQTVAAPTVAPTIAPTATPAPPDPVSVTQSFYDALNARDVDAAMALFADDVRWRGTPTLSGKESVRSYLQGVADAGFTSEVSDLRATRGRVTYSWSSFKNGVLYASGEDTMVVVNGRITAIESYAVLGADIRPKIKDVSFTTTGQGFSGPDQIEAGWARFILANQGQEPYHIQLVKLDAGKSVDDLKAALTADPENYPAWAEPYGGPNAPDPGGSASTILYLEAGSYALIDIIPDAAGVPHFQNGMVKALAVTEASGRMAGEPKAGVTVAMGDFNYTLSGPLTAGEQILSFNNVGQQVHEAFLVKLDDGKTAEDFLNTAPGAPPPGASVGGITGIAPGTHQYVSLRLEPGTYALFCFLPDPNTHAPHFAQGMILEITVK